MAYGICYTQSGNVKKYERDQLESGSIPMYVTGYTVGYPSTAYYSDAFRGGPNFYCFAYPGPPNWPIYPGFTEGTGEYIYNVSFNGTDTYNKIYNLMTDTPPDGFVLDKNGRDVVITKFATVYSCNLDVKYGGITNSINGGTQKIEKEFRYRKVDKPIQTTNIRYPVTISISGYTVRCYCERVTGIPGTNNGNVTLGIVIELGDGVGGGVGGGRTEVIQFSWVMKNGINESKSCSVPYYLGSGFTTQESWEIDNGDGTKTYYTFHINHDSIPARPNS